MNDFLSAFLLILVPGMPLVLAFSALRSRLSRPGLFALLPALVLVIVLTTISTLAPIVFSIKIPWLLLGAELGIDGLSLLFLSLSVILWITASLHLYRPNDHVVSHRFTSFFMITMAGNFGVILSTDLVTFFTFLTLMSYGFYGLLADRGDEATRKAGRIYLVFMVLADLVIFEALLIAAATTNDLSFVAVQHAMSAPSSSDLYLSVVLLGFAAKAGFWPLHFWLLPAFRLSPPAVALLIAGVPVAMGLLGTLRWLPLGEIHAPELGLIIKSLGAVATIYAVLFAVLQAQLQSLRKALPAYIVVFFTGLYAAAVGIGLTDPAVWRQYETLAPFFIIMMVISLLVLVHISIWLTTKSNHTDEHEKQTEPLYLPLEHLSGAVVNWFTVIRTQTLSLMRMAWLIKANSFRLVRVWKKILDDSEHFLQSWSIAITLLLILSIGVALISASL